MFTHLFVPVDADVTSDKVLATELVDAAAELAKKLGARITLAHVALPVSSPAVPVDSFADAYRAMLEVLEARNAAASKLLEVLAMRVKTPCTTKLVTKAGTVPDLIVATAKEVGADVIVVATHGRKGLKRVVLGSVAERVAHLSTMPVLLLPPRH